MFPKELNPKNFKKIVHFSTLKETQSTIFWPTWVFTSWGVALFRVTLSERAQATIYEATIYENDIAQIAFIFLQGSNITSEKRCHMKKYFLFCVTFFTVQVK